MISGNTQSGIVLIGDTDVSCNSIVGNLIGTDKTGNVEKPNLWEGILLDAPSNTVGGVNPGEANTISGNGRNGIKITARKILTIPFP